MRVKLKVKNFSLKITNGFNGGVKKPMWNRKFLFEGIILCDTIFYLWEK